MPDFGSSAVWLSLLTLTFLEIVLGVDNIIFISITASRLPEDQQKKATNVGLILAMVMRILLLFGISWLIAMENPFFSFDFWGIKGAVSGQALIMVGGGIFLLYKSVSEIHHKLEGDEHIEGGKGNLISIKQAIVQITLINIVFSFDSILTAVGMTQGVDGALAIMIIAVVFSVIIMMLFAVPVGRFVNKHPTIQMLGLSFLILIGFMLILEGAHLGHMTGYLYFAIAFSLLVEFLNIKLRKNKKPVQLHGVKENAKKEGII
ncbi:UNVERIFIED_CONTAM: hypothetical protein GTU68_049450 [Idotea baltica]|nr:hypothetical protein [Idotea baltica]